MTYALVLAGGERRPKDHQEEQAWLSFLGDVEKLETTDAPIERLGASAWLIRLDSGLGSLASIVRSGEDWNVAVQTVFFDQRPSINRL